MSDKFTVLHITRGVLKLTGYLTAKAEALHLSALDRLEYRTRARLFKIMDAQVQADTDAEERINAIRTNLAIQNTKREAEKKAIKQLLTGINVEQAIREGR